MTQPEQFVAAARASLGTRWMHQGRLPGVGLDCGGLVICSAAAAGEVLQDVVGYDRPLSGEALVNAISAIGERVRGPMQLGDVLLMSLTDVPCHLAIYTGENRIIHTWASIRKVVEHDYNSKWQECLREFSA